MAKSLNSDAFKYQRILMKCTGFWPRRNPSSIYRLYGFVHYIFVLIFTVTLLINAAVLSDFSQLIQSWSMFFALLNCSMKFSIFLLKRPQFLDLLDFLESSHFTYYDEDFDVYLRRIIKFASIVVKLFFCSGMTTVASILISPLLNSEHERQTPLPFPIDLKEKPYAFYVVVYAFQCISLSSAAWTSIGFDNLSTSMMGISSSYFEILKKSIVKITTPQFLVGTGNELFSNKNFGMSYQEFDKKINTELYACVEHHVALMNFTQSIEQIFTYTYLSQFLCSAAGICLVGFTFVNANPGSLEFIFALSFLGTLLFQITLYCSYGNEVTLRSSEIGTACYETEWFYCGPSVRKTMFLIMERSKRPIVLTAGKFVTLSLPALLGVFKSAASYAAVLRQHHNN